MVSLDHPHAVGRGEFRALKKTGATGFFDIGEYQHRLRMLREIISGENQQEFAERLGIPFKRWNNYERGYPIPRETAFILMEKFRGISVEWLWFGMEGNLSDFYRRRIRAAEEAERNHQKAVKALTKAESKVKEAATKRRSVVQSVR